MIGVDKKKRGINFDLEKLIEVFKSGDKNEIDGYLENKLFNFEILNEVVKDKYNRELLLYLVLKYENINGFF